MNSTTHRNANLVLQDEIKQGNHCLELKAPLTGGGESPTARSGFFKKTASSKRTSLPRSPDYTREFHKDWQRLTRSGRYDMGRLKEAMLLLIAGDQPLDAEWHDHALKGNWRDHRECHIGGDFLLIYQLEGERLNFVRAGTHADLFDE